MAEFSHRINTPCSYNEIWSFGFETNVELRLEDKDLATGTAPSKAGATTVDAEKELTHRVGFSRTHHRRERHTRRVDVSGRTLLAPMTLAAMGVLSAARRFVYATPHQTSPSGLDENLSFARCFAPTGRIHYTSCMWVK